MLDGKTGSDGSRLPAWIPELLNSGKKCSKIWVYLARTPREIVLFLKFRKYFSIRHWKLPEIQTGSFGFFAG